METKEHVEHLLKNYHEIKRDLDILNFEIERFTGLSYSEVITALTFTNPDGERVRNNNVSDKTARIALAYRESTDKINCDDVLALVLKYNTQKREMDMLDYCITLLEPRLSKVITDMVISRLTWKETSGKYNVSQVMLGKYRKKAIVEIVKMFGVREAV